MLRSAELAGTFSRDPTEFLVAHCDEQGLALGFLRINADLSFAGQPERLAQFLELPQGIVLERGGGKDAPAGVGP